MSAAAKKTVVTVSQDSECLTTMVSVDQLTPDPQPPRAGAYRIIDELGVGGGGAVYRAERASDGQKAAVKVLRRDLALRSEMVQRFLREVRAVKLIEHPNIVEIYEMGSLSDGRPYYVMELLEGMTLRALVRQRGKIPPDEIIGLMEPVCAAVGAAHERDIVHRDLKSSNIFVSRGEDGQTVKLLDFGVAKMLRPEPGEEPLSRAGTRLGTCVAMAPEQIRGQAIDGRADVYALGILLFELLTGCFPFSSDHELELLRMHLENPPPRPSQAMGVSPMLDGVVGRALQKSADARYGSVAEFFADMQRAIERANAGEDSGIRESGALAILVDARVDLHEGDEQDDDLMDDLMAVQDIVDEILREGGFDISLVTSTSVLGTTALADAHLGDLCSRARALAQEITDELLDREEPDPRVHVNVTVHRANATVSVGADGKSLVTGGEILDLSSWAPEQLIPNTLYVSSSILDILER